MDFFDLDPIGWALLGFLAGGLSSWLIRGRAARGCLANILVGILGGLIGGTLAKSTGFGDTGGFLGSLFVALLVRCDRGSHEKRRCAPRSSKRRS